MAGSYTMNMNTLKYNSELCTGCEMCIWVCPHGVFELKKDRARVWLVRPEACMECGACQMNCPREAIEVDSGVGCATAMMFAALTGRKEVTCGCGKKEVRSIGRRAGD
jgi:NAD-dependent dihydropyrimidine dehydrogenase PreA subunit